MFCISDHSELYIIYVARGKGQVLDFASSKFVFKRQIKKEHFKYKRLRPVTLAVGGIREVREDWGGGRFRRPGHAGRVSSWPSALGLRQS